MVRKLINKDTATKLSQRTQVPPTSRIVLVVQQTGS